MAGYIKLHRGWEASCQFAEEPYCERAAWCWLLTNAAWKDTVRRNHKGEVVPVLRGQFHTSLRTLAAEWKWSPKRVKSFLEVLQKCGSAETASEQSGTLITICKYKEYQAKGNSRETASDTASSTAGKQSGNTQEEGKEGKEENKTEAKASPDAVFWSMALDYIGQDKRGLIGKWIKDYTRPRVAEAIAAAQVERAVDPVPYIAATLRRRGKRGDDEEMTMPC